MSHIPGRHIFLSLVFLTVVVSTFAQDPVARSNKENSPYSKYGLGEERNGFNTILKGMATVSSAYSNPYAANTDNPASYARIRFTTYDAGGESRIKTVTGASGTEKYRTGMATLSYFNVAFPGGKYLGFNIGLRPEKRVYYYLDDTAAIPNFGTGIKSRRADGSLNYAFMGVAGKYKNLSVGANFGYLFGTTDYLSYLLIMDSTYEVYNSLFNRSQKMGGIYWNLGGLYDIKIKKNTIIRLGVTATMSQNIKTTNDETWINYSNTTGFADSAIAKAQVKGNITLPTTWGAGIQFLQSDKLLVALDYKSTQWGQYRFLGEKDSLADNAYTVALGAEYTPDITAIHSYFSRVSYRAGFYYGTDKVLMRSTPMNVMAFTTGISLPFKRTTDRVNLSLEIGKRGTTSNGLLQENFVRFGLGVSLNDRWFIKTKYE